MELSAIVTALIAVSLASAVGIALYRILTKTGQAKSASDYGRKWLAWMVLIGTISTLPGFFYDFDANSFFKWVLVVVSYGGLAFVAGWIYGKIFAKRIRGKY